MVDFKNKMVISKEEWSLFYDLCIQSVEMHGAECFCEHVVDEKCTYCRAKEWIERD